METLNFAHRLLILPRLSVCRLLVRSSRCECRRPRLTDRRRPSAPPTPSSSLCGSSPTASCSSSPTSSSPVPKSKPPCNRRRTSVLARKLRTAPRSDDAALLPPSSSSAMAPQTPKTTIAHSRTLENNMNACFAANLELFAHRLINAWP